MIAIVADIHGNYPALKAVVSDIESLKVDKIYSLGDVAGYYSMINECIELLINKNITNIMGNHDYYLLNNKRCPRSSIANKCLDFQRELITKENLLWLRGSVEKIDIDNIRMVHGGWKNHLDEYLRVIKDDYFQGVKGKYFFSGHTHVQMIKKMKQKIYCNPGSVGQPRDGDPKAGYAVFDGNQIILKRVKYNIRQIEDNMREAGFTENFYGNLSVGSRIGGVIDKVQD